MSSPIPSQSKPAPIECSICREEIESDLFELNHKVNGFVHRFHKECAELWLKDHISCPSCNSEANPDQVIPIMIASNTLNVSYAANAFSDALEKNNLLLQELLIKQISNQPALGPELLLKVIVEHDEMFDLIASFCDRSLSETHRVFGMKAIANNDIKKLFETIRNSPYPHETLSTLLFFSVGCFLKGYCDQKIPLGLIEDFGGDFGFEETFNSIMKLFQRDELEMVDIFLNHSSLHQEIKDKIRKHVTEKKALHHSLKLIEEKNLEALKKIVETGNLDASANQIIEAVIKNFDELPDFLTDFCSKLEDFAINARTIQAFDDKKFKLCLQMLCISKSQITARVIFEKSLTSGPKDFYKDLLETFKFETPDRLANYALQSKREDAYLAVINKYEIDLISIARLLNEALEQKNIEFAKILIANCSINDSDVQECYESGRGFLPSIFHSLSNFTTTEKNLELAKAFLTRKTLSPLLCGLFLSYFKENIQQIFPLIPERKQEPSLMFATLFRHYDLTYLKELFDDDFVNAAVVEFAENDKRYIPHEISCHPGLREETIKEAAEIAREMGNDELRDDLIFHLGFINGSIHRLLSSCTIS